MRGRWDREEGTESREGGRWGREGSREGGEEGSGVVGEGVS